MEGLPVNDLGTAAEHMDTSYLWRANKRGQRAHIENPETGQPREVFLNGGKEGSQFDAMLADAATIISDALQYGVPIAALAKSVGRIPNAAATPVTLDRLTTGSLPTSALGAALDLLIAHQPRLDEGPSNE